MINQNYRKYIVVYELSLDTLLLQKKKHYYYQFTNLGGTGMLMNTVGHTHLVLTVLHSVCEL